MRKIISHLVSYLCTAHSGKNMTLGLDSQRGECPYSMPLCQLAMGQRIDLWDNTWVKASLRKGLPLGGICDKKRIAELKQQEAPLINLVVRNRYADETDED